MSKYTIKNKKPVKNFERSVDRPRRKDWKPKKRYGASRYSYYENENNSTNQAYRRPAYQRPETVEKKYELLLDNTFTIGTITLYRIRALRDFGTVKKGDLGGFVQSEKNLSHEGTCWLHDFSKSYHSGLVEKDAQIHHKAEVRNFAIATDFATMWDYSALEGNSVLGGHAKTKNWSTVGDDSRVTEYAIITQHAITGGRARVGGNVLVGGYVHIRGQAKVDGNGTISGGIYIHGNSTISGTYTLFGKFTLTGQTFITSNSDLMVFRCFWNSDLSELVYVATNKIFSMKGFLGTDLQLLEWAREHDGDNYDFYKNLVDMVNAQVKLMERKGLV